MANTPSRVSPFAAPMWRSSVRPFLAPPTRIAIAGDWHSDTGYAVAAIDHAAKRDAGVLLHMGDFGYNFTDSYLDALDDALRRHDLELGFVDGNHENFDRLLAQPVAADGLRHLRERIVHLPRGFRWRWGTTRCLAVGGAYSIDRFLRTPGKSWWPQETITVAQARDIITAGRADVMFCHDCPAGIEVPGAGVQTVRVSRRGTATLRGASSAPAVHRGRGSARPDMARALSPPLPLAPGRRWVSDGHRRAGPQRRSHRQQHGRRQPVGTGFSSARHHRAVAATALGMNHTRFSLATLAAAMESARNLRFRTACQADGPCERRSRR
jgi:hypothetical protein